MLDRTRRNHFRGAVVVLILIQLSATSGTRLPYRDLRSSGFDCGYRAASIYLWTKGLSCSSGLQISHEPRCENLTADWVECNLHQGINTIVVLADETTCTSDSVSIAEGSLVIFNKSGDLGRSCSTSYKLGHFAIESNQTQMVPFRWSPSGGGHCSPRFLLTAC